jgi:hypothetical protein
MVAKYFLTAISEFPTNSHQNKTGNGILIKNGVRKYVGYVVIDCIGSIIPWVVAGYPMVEVFFV